MTLFELAAVLTLDKAAFDKGIGEAESGATSFGSKLKSGLGTAAKTAGVALAAVGTAAVSTTKSLLDGAAEAAVYGDSIDKMSQKMGLSAEAYQEWDAIMQHSGTSIESLQAGMKTLANAVESGNGAFERLGISQEMIAEMNNEELFSATISALQNVENETERTYLAGQLLGRGATELGALLNTSAEDTEAMRQRVHELGGVMSDEAVKAAAAYQDSLQDMQTAFSGIKRGITSEFLPAITTVMDGITAIATGDDSGFGMLTEGINAFIEGLNETVPKIISIGSQIVESLITAISQSAPMIIESAADIVSSLAEGIINNIPTLASSAVLVVQTLISKTSEMLPKLISAGLEIVKSLAKGIVDNIKMMTQTAVEVVVSIAETLTEPDTLLDILDAGLQIILGLVDGIVSAIPTLVEALPVVVENIITVLLGSIPLIIDAGIQLLTSLVAALPDIITAVVAAIPKILSGIVNALINSIPLIIQAGVDLLISLVQNLPTIITEIVKAIPQIISGIVEGLFGNIDKIIMAGVQLFVALIENLPTIIVEIVKAVPLIIGGIVDAFGSLMGSIIEIGGNLLKGIWEGITGAASWLWDQVSGFFGGLVDGICDFLGIHSPSTVFADMGKNMALGIGEGFDDEFDGIRKDMNDQMDFTATADVEVNRKRNFTDTYSEYGNGGVGYSSASTGEKQPLIVVVQLESGLELARALIENINDAKRLDGLAY